MAKQQDQFAELVQTLEDALLIVGRRSKPLGLTLLRAELELKATVKKSGGSSAKLAIIVPVEASAKLESTKIQTFRMSLTPAGGVLDLGGSDSNELADDIVALAETASNISSLSPKWVPGDLSVAINFALEGSKKFAVVIGGGGAEANAHSIKLTFRKSK
jgi:hypothetical protein